MLASAPSARLALAALCVSGCANHVRYVESSSDRRASEVVEQQLSVRGPAPVVAEPSFRLELEKRETLAWHTERTTTRTEEHTPYRAARELYEVPGGLISVPLATVLELADVLLLGSLPDESVDAYLFWSFAALNPVLNAESPGRVEPGEVSSRTERIDAGQQVQTVPLPRFPVSVSLDGGEPQTHLTDAQGHLELNLLEFLPPTLSWPPRRVSLEGRDPRTGESAIAQSYFLDRPLSERLRRAAPLLDVHGSPDASVAELARAVYGLDQLGFPREAAQIQDALYARWQTASPEQLGEFRSALDRHYATGAPFDAGSDVPAAISAP